MEDKYFVYKHIRKDLNLIFYVGIGKINKKFNTFKMQHYRAYTKQGRNPIWKNIINKTEYEVEILYDNISFEKAKFHEIRLIKNYGKKKDSGLLCNITDGGETVADYLITAFNDPKCSQKVFQYTLDGKFLKVWESTNEIKRQLGYDNSVIRKSLNGKTKSPNISYNFQWFLEYQGEKVEKSDSGKTTLHKGVVLNKDGKQLVFHSREECANFFKVKSSQITNAIKNNYKFKGYKIENK